MLERVVQWLKNNTVDAGGIAVSSRRAICYPEVTGYLIPSLYQCGEHKMADSFARRLMGVQKPDGSIPGPDDPNSYAFDTGQVIRGWVAALPRLPELERPLRSACEWLINNSTTDGRLPVPEANWSLGRRGSISEAVHLYAVVPLAAAGKLLDEKSYIDFGRTSLDYYANNHNLTEFRQSNMLTHLYVYIQEALFDLGAHDIAQRGMKNLEVFQQSNGAIPGYFDVNWICTPGQFQSAIVWYKLGQYDQANAAIEFMEQFINSSGGFFGSYGVDADYFPSEEISWANKFYLDAAWLRILRFFDKENAIFPDKVAADDGRLRAVIDYSGDLNNKRVLDVGCGKGRFASAIKRRYSKADITGLDVSEELLRCVPAGIKTCKASMLSIPFGDESFDTIFCIEALEHAVRIEQAIAEMSRLLRPGGRIVVIDKNAEKWGAMKTPAWEKWFRPEELTAIMSRYLDTVDYKFIDCDGHDASDRLFVAWRGARKAVYVSEHTRTTDLVQLVGTASGESIEALGPEQWHESIIGQTTPQQIAAKVKSGEGPEWLDTLLDNTNIGDEVLELGCGTGELSAFLASKGRKATLLDYSESSLNFCREVFEQLKLDAKFIVADVTAKFPFEDNSLDVVFSSGLLEHFNDAQIARIMKESARVSRGKVISMVPNANSIAYRLGKWRQERTGQWKWGYESPKRTLISYFKKAGLREVVEYSVAENHSIKFLTSPELLSFGKTLGEFYEIIGPEELAQLNQGYLLVTVGHKKKSRRLAVIPSDPIEAYEDAGYGGWLQDYYNPEGYFDEVYCLSPLEKEKRFSHGMQIIPTQPGEFSARLQELGIDVVRAYGGYWACDMACDNKVAGIAVVVSVHDTNPTLLHDSIRDADCVIAVSNAVKQLLLNAQVRPENIYILPNRVDIELFRPVSDAELQAEFKALYPGKYRILHVGRKAEQKNLDTLIKSLSILGPDYTCIFIGRGDVKAYWALAEKVGVLQRCHFIESIPNDKLPMYYSWCDCMATPSRWEGFGIVFIEALACGAVVVTSDIAPMNEYITHMESGILVKDYESPESLSKAIMTACTDQNLRRVIQANACKAAEPFGSKIIDRREAELYKNILRMAGKDQFVSKIITNCVSRKDFKPARSKSQIIAPKNARYEKLQQMLSASGRIIDLGCGNNPIAGCEVGVDCNIEPSQRSMGYGDTIDESAFKRRNIRFVNQRIDTELPFGDKEFDFAYSHHVFEHLDDPATACREMMRIARSGAIITPSIFSEIAFGRPYHKWLVTERDNTIYFIKKRHSEDRPFGEHPQWNEHKGWIVTEQTNPFDMILNDGDWYKESLCDAGRKLREKLQYYWHSHSDVIEMIFLWEDSFNYEIIDCAENSDTVENEQQLVVQGK